MQQMQPLASGGAGTQPGERWQSGTRGTWLLTSSVPLTGTTTLLHEMGEKHTLVPGNILNLIQALVLWTEEPGSSHQAPK